VNIVICKTAGNDVTVPYVICEDDQLCMSSPPLTDSDQLISTAATEITPSEVSTNNELTVNCVTVSRKRKRNFSSWKKVNANSCEILVSSMFQVLVE